MRLVLALILIHGLAPSLAELAEAAVHYAVEGHLVHTSADAGDLGDLGDEHGCGTTEHRCSCCASQAVACQPGAAVAGPWSPPLERRASRPQRLASLHEPAPPHRPPIAS